MSDTLLPIFQERAERHGAAVAFRSIVAGGAARDEVVTWREWYDASRRFAAALVAGGFAPGAAVAVLAGNRPVWPIADLGTLMAGMVSVGLYPTSAPAQVAQVLADARAAVVVVDTAAQLEKVRAARGELPWPLAIISSEQARDAVMHHGAEIIGWDDWQSRGRAALGEPRIAAELDRRERRAVGDDLAVLIYTSGSTGEPKGARLPHRYLLASARSIRDVLAITEADSMLSILPFCHAGERVFGLYTRVLTGASASFVEDHARIWDAARAGAPTVFGGLPRFYEKAYDVLSDRMARASGEPRARWERAVELGRLRSRRRRAGLGVPAALEREWRDVGEAVIAEARALFGGAMRVATSGGAKLPAEVAEFLDAVGVTVLGAYGLTEHLCVAFHRADRYDFESVGLPMPGTALRIADDGEVLVRRCALTFDGYHDRPRESRDAFTEDGAWLRTGDLGAIDERGMLHITGRKKELIALSTGKKVAPLPIEARLGEDQWIAQAMLYGEGRKFIAALLALRREAVEAWARAEDLGPLEYRELLEHPAVRARVQAAVDRVNATVSRTEQIKRWALLERELRLDEGELTPTLKIRRPHVTEKYRQRLDALYDGAERTAERSAERAR